MAPLDNPFPSSHNATCVMNMRTGMHTEKVSQHIGLLGLSMAGLTCIIGSGWLFGAYLAAKIAGPAAIFSWIIDGLAMMFMALTYVELGSMLPRAGGMARYLEYTHGSLAGFMNGWANWLSIVTVIPVEAVASTQYLSSWPFHWTHNLFNPNTNFLSPLGLCVASVLIICYFFINYWSVRLFIRFVIFITTIKIVVPILTVILLAYSAFHPSNFTAYGHTIAPYGWPAVFTAIAVSGISLAFHGFQSTVNLAAETRNAARNLPLAIIFSIGIALVLYVLLQIVFIGAVDPIHLHNGWHNYVFRSPFADLAIALNLHVLVLSLYVDAFISPSGTAITYMATTSRMLYGMGMNGYMPKFMTYLHPEYRTPRNAMWVNLIISFIFLWIFRGWAHLVPVVSMLGIIAYLAGPVCSMSLRKLAAHYPRPIRLPLLNIIAPIAFIIISLILHWARWPLTGKVIFLMSIGFVIYVYYQMQQGWPNFKEQFKAGLWFIFYLISVAVLSYIGSEQFGGNNIIPYGWDMLSVALVALAFYFWAINSAWLNPALNKILDSIAVDTSASVK